MVVAHEEAYCTQECLDVLACTQEHDLQAEECIEILTMMKDRDLTPGELRKLLTPLVDEALLAFEAEGGKVIPKIWLQNAEAAKEALSPAATSVDLNREAQAKARENIKSAGEDILEISRAEARLDRLIEDGNEAQKSFETKQDHLAQVRLAVAEQVDQKVAGQRA